MVLAEWFQKHYNSDVTGVGKAPLRKRFSKFRQTRIKERTFAGVKKVQDIEGIKPDTKYYIMPRR